MRFDVTLQVRPKDGVRDPQGEAVQEALRSLGFSSVGVAYVGRTLRFAVDGENEAAARGTVEEMCRQMLVNPNIETFDFSLAQHSSGAP